MKLAEIEGGSMLRYRGRARPRVQSHLAECRANCSAPRMHRICMFRCKDAAVERRASSVKGA
jgi:hypothetical protein